VAYAGFVLLVWVYGARSASGALLDEVAEDDQVIETDGIKVVVDPMSLRHLDGAEVDYKEDLMGGGFAIKNPNAQSTCGCGHSFTTEGQGGGQGEGVGAAAARDEDEVTARVEQVKDAIRGLIDKGLSERTRVF